MVVAQQKGSLSSVPIKLGEGWGEFNASDAFACASITITYQKDK